MVRKMLVIGGLLVALASLMLGCAVKQQQSSYLQLYKYSDVLLPTPQKVMLYRPASGAKTAAKVTITKADQIHLMKVLRSAVDRSLRNVPAPKDGLKPQQKFSLELDYNNQADLELMVGDKLITFSIKQIIVDLNGKSLVIDTGKGIKQLSGLSFTDDFIKFIQNYSPDTGFPLPPAVKGEMNVGQLPLAQPGDDHIEFLPPAKPQSESGFGH
ncbi:MAG TPA: hypothetical protein VHQ46_03720 [Desulfobacteria bacterium]|nr:hypothetical protein [Desulfobacteria bacterium]